MSPAAPSIDRRKTLPLSTQLERRSGLSPEPPKGWRPVEHREISHRFELEAGAR